MSKVKDFLLKREKDLSEVCDQLESQINFCTLHKHYDMRRALTQAQRFTLDQIEIIQATYKEVEEIEDAHNSESDEWWDEYDPDLDESEENMKKITVTNSEFIERLMNFSNNGELMQLFIITAIEQYAKLALEERLPDGGFIHPDAWQRCAKEVLEELDARCGK